MQFDGHGGPLNNPIFISFFAGVEFGIEQAQFGGQGFGVNHRIEVLKQKRQGFALVQASVGRKPF